MANSNRPYWWVRPHVSYPKDNSKWIAAREQWQQLGGDNPRTETGWKFALLPAILLACAAAAVYFGALHAIAEIGNAATPSDSLSYEAVPLSSYSSLGAEPASEAAAPAAGDPSRTYIDGEGFHRMMLLDSDAVEACNSAFETLSATNYQIDAAAAQALRASIDDVSARRDALPIDSSYREYSNQLGRMLLFGGAGRRRVGRRGFRLAGERLPGAVPLRPRRGEKRAGHGHGRQRRSVRNGKRRGNSVLVA